MAINTGRVHLGSKVSLREMRRGRARIVILSSNCPEETREIIENCGKPFPVSTIVVNDPGDSKILDIVEA